MSTDAYPLISTAEADPRPAAEQPAKFDWSAPRLVPLYAAIHLCVQGAISTAVYNASLRLAAGRESVGRWYAAWELSIPLWPAMIVPYLSVYALFVATFFLCRNWRELAALALRLTTAAAVSGLCFVLFPLTCGFRRPAIDGWPATLFRLLDAADAPYNMAPSLHVTTTVILAATLYGLLGARLRWVMLAWCATIVLSTLLTWQHHLIDVATGLALGAACVRWVRLPPPAP